MSFTLIKCNINVISGEFLGIFLNIIMKFSDMYDAKAFPACFSAALLGLIVTIILSIRNGKPTPAMVLPAIFIISASILSVDRPIDLWRFEIKH